jgi:hypothetical protein
MNRVKCPNCKKLVQRVDKRSAFGDETLLLEISKIEAYVKCFPSNPTSSPYWEEKICYKKHIC